MQNKFFIISLIVLLAAVMILAGFFYWQQTHPPNSFNYNTSPSPTEIEVLPSSNEAITPLPSSYEGTPPEISRGNINKKQIIFTFDFGSGSQSGQKILAVLKKHSVKGTFFTTGKSAQQNVDLIKQIAAEGHEIFNHTYSHPHLPQLTDDQIKEELNKTEQIIFDLTGQSTRPYFRPPYGERDARVLVVAAQAGYQSVVWSTDGGDWITDITADQVKQRIYKGLKPGAIILMHVGDNISGQILDEVFTYIEGQGYKIVGLSEGLK